MNRLVVASLLAAAATGAQAHTFTDNARVRSVLPQYENVTVPHTVCHSEWIQEPRRVGQDPGQVLPVHVTVEPMVR